MAARAAGLMGVFVVMSVDVADAALALEFSRVTFSYATGDVPALHDVSLSVPAGAFALVFGDTGAGKSTLMTLACPALVPAGSLEGDVRVFGRRVSGLSRGEGASLVGIVMQDADAQIVCDDVRSEMAFGLESLGLPRAEMGQRIAESATFLGMGPWFGRRTSELSGGQRQTLVLASVLAMRPRLLLLDEPVSQLDPIAAAAFAALVGRANRELGITVVVVTHDPGVFAPYASQAYLMEAGVVAPAALGDEVSRDGHGRVGGVAPTVAAREVLGGGRRGTGAKEPAVDEAAALHDVWFRYARGGDWVFSGLDISFGRGETHVVLGGNGSGKTTLLRLVGGAAKAQRGRAVCTCRNSMGYVPQQEKALVNHESVRDELMAWSSSVGYDLAEALRLLARLGFDAHALLDCHPLDLSGGQRRLLVLAKVLLTRPGLLLLDEPTVGLDGRCALNVADALRVAARDGAAVVVATHDVAFARHVATRASLLFDGQVAAAGSASDFFATAWLWGA